MVSIPIDDQTIISALNSFIPLQMTNTPKFKVQTVTCLFKVLNQVQSQVLDFHISKQPK